MDSLTGDILMATKKRSASSVTIENMIDDHDLLRKLIVGIGEVSIITGIPQRQLRYWEQKGIIKSQDDESSSNRRFNYLEIKKILLLKELLDEGYTLDAATKKIQKRIELLHSAFEKLKVHTKVHTKDK